jgi:outer membrane protein assembly factor BamB
MKNKTTGLLLSIILLATFAAIFVAVKYFARSSNGKLPLLSLNEAWSFQADDPIVSTPILIDNQIIFRTADNIYSLNTIDGKMNWEIAARASEMTINMDFIRKPIVGNSKLVISEEQENSISIYATKTGEKIWTIEGQANMINAPLEIVDDIMVVTRHDGNLVVYDLTSRQKLWEVALPPRSSTPIAANSDVVIVGMGDVLRVYGLKDGKLLNEKTYVESTIVEIALSGSNIFISYGKNRGDWSISLLQLDSLDENWVFHAGKIVDHDLSVTSNHLSVFGDALLLLDTNSGNILWKDDAQRLYSAPAFHENSLFFISTPVGGMFVKDKYREICKVEIGEDEMEDCSVLSSAGMSFSRPRLLGPLVMNDLLIVSRDSEVTAFTLP